jgi:hypothetical protein
MQLSDAHAILPLGAYRTQMRASGEHMPLNSAFMRHVVTSLGLLLGIACANGAGAQTVNFHIGFTGKVDCQSPIALSNVPISADGTGQINGDGTGYADLTQTAFVLSTRIHFEGRLGRPTESPGGTALARVSGKNSLRLMWNLPNNQFVVNIAVRGQNCSASFSSNLKSGKSQHTLFDGNIYHYCGKPRVESSSCQVR